MKGVYLLLLSINKKIHVKVGSLGIKDFEKGLYVYVGSAQKNLENRILRHVKSDKRKFWHIDYLLSSENVKVLNVFYKEAERTFECEFANELSKITSSINGFGSSDCKCRSHLFIINNYELLRCLLQKNNFKEVLVDA